MASFGCGLRRICLAIGLGVTAWGLRADDGYGLWLRYDRIADGVRRDDLSRMASRVVLSSPSSQEGPLGDSSLAELNEGLGRLLGRAPVVERERCPEDPALGAEGYCLKAEAGARPRLVIRANSTAGLLYGSFALLRDIAAGWDIASLSVTSVPKVSRRILNHWDNLDRSVERGYAGFSLWEWTVLPDHVSARYRDYARACASIGINGSVLTNVNANALILTGDWLQKVSAIAGALRPYAVRVYLTARYSAPIEIGGLSTADPLDPTVAAWWKAKVDEIYAIIPDFGGFLVKADSEGQPGPQTYHRTQAQGANVLADALAPHGGILLWRAFVYQSRPGEDRVMQAYDEFKPLDGQFRENVVLQVKNGAFDFQPREPFHPLFGAMPRTAMGLELQVTQEYLGQGKQVAFLAPLWKETLESDTHRPTAGSTVARVVDGSIGHHALSAVCGVANTGTDRNWTGHPLAQANWYAFGRLAWDHSLTSETIATEWTRLTFGPDPRVSRVVVPLLVESREAVVDYMDPLGLSGIFAEGHHYGPEPWLATGRADWTSVYYHRADARGLGFDRTASGSNALSQYAPEIASLWADPNRCPERYLLWFHHVDWGFRCASGRSLWDELCRHYQHGVEQVQSWQRSWATLEGVIDQERFTHVRDLLGIQERDARVWRDACLLYFQTFSHRPLPPGVESPAHDLAYYKAIRLRWLAGHAEKN